MSDQAVLSPDSPAASSADRAPGLYAKIAQVVTEVGEVAKTGTNDFHGYKYVTAETILTALRKPLAEKQVALLSSVTAIEERAYKTSRGNESIITTVHVDFTFVDGATGEMHRCSWAGQGDDPADKGLGKAYTNAIKTFLREQFLLPQGDDPEGDKTTDQRAGERSESGPPRRSGNGTNKASIKQVEYLRKLIHEAGWTVGKVKGELVAVGVTDVDDVGKAIDGLSRQQASALIEGLAPKQEKQ
jgi:hypothetical protein